MQHCFFRHYRLFKKPDSEQIDVKNQFNNLINHLLKDVTSRLTQEISQMFDYSGIKHDKHVREHEVYSVRLGQDQPLATNQPADCKKQSAVDWALSIFK